jgi:predicted HD phosphohydrolase
MAQPKVLVIQLETESMQDYVKFCVFVNLGAKRNLRTAFQQYYETNSNTSESWSSLAAKNNWVERAAEYDKKV